MKLVTLLLLSGIFHHSTPGLLLLDTTYRTTPAKTEDFTWNMYTNRQFPIYADDRKAIIEGAQKLAKVVNNAVDCNAWDTTAANHSRFILSVRCDDYKTYTVRFQTKITGQNLNCNFELVNKEIDPRKVQRKLIDFATYLEQEQ